MRAALQSILVRVRLKGGLRAKIPREVGVLISLIAIAIGFQIISKTSFFQASTWGNILAVSAEVGVVAIGATLLMIAGEFDLSVGSNFAFCGMLYALLTIQYDWSPVPTLIIVLLSGSLIGLANGLVTVFAGIPSFITTLGGLLIWRGLVLAISEGWPLSQTGEPTLMMKALSGNLTENVNASVLWWVGLGLLAWAILSRTSLGNWIFAVGGNAGAARACGVPVRRVKLVTFTLSGFLAGFAGLLQFSRLGSFSPTYGEGLELEAIVATVIGGTILTGGSGGVIGTLFGTILIGMISSGLVLAGAPVYWFRTFVGITLVIAVILNRYLSRSA